MQTPTALQVQYDDHQRQMAWVNDMGWMVDPPKPRGQVRVAVAQALIALATRLTLTSQQRTA